MMKTTWKHLPIEEQLHISELYKKGDDLVGVATQYGWNSLSLARQVRHFIYYQNLFMKGTTDKFSVPNMSNRVYTDYTTLATDDAIIISDLEIPDADPEMLKLAFMTGVRFGIKKLIIAGDFLATDQEALNDWVSTWKETCEVTYENALGMSINLLDQFAQQFEEIIICEGNHDDRIARKTKGEIHLGMLLKGTQAKYTRYPFLWLKTTKRGYVYVVHPRKGSSNSVALGQRIYSKKLRQTGVSRTLS